MKPFKNGSEPTEVINLNRKILISPSEFFLQKVQEVCLYINDREWSGHLYYTVDESSRQVFIELVDFFLNDISDVDNAYWTQSEADVDEFRYRDEYDLIDPKFQRGFVHSHVNLATSFSGPDMEDLRKGAELNTTYLSVIVNNRLDITAKFSESVEDVVPGKTIKTRSGTKIHIPEKRIQYVTVTNCEIEKFEAPEIELNPILLRIREIQKRKETAAKAVKTGAGFHKQNAYGQYNKPSNGRSNLPSQGGISRWYDDEHFTGW